MAPKMAKECCEKLTVTYYDGKQQLEAWMASESQSIPSIEDLKPNRENSRHAPPEAYIWVFHGKRANLRPDDANYMAITVLTFSKSPSSGWNEEKY